MTQLVQDKRPDLESIQDATKDVTLGLIPAWSHSSLKTFESCAYRLYISKVKKVQENFGPAAARGTEIHTLAENYVQGNYQELPTELGKFAKEFKELKELYAQGQVELEGEWGFTIDWKPCGWMDPKVWARVKLDALVTELDRANNNNTSARVIDYKTGKKIGNEISHSQQGITYAIATFFKVPELESISVEFWYLDHAETTKQVYTREEAMLFYPKLQERALTLTTATEFTPNPSDYNCRWCSYKDGEYPVCEWSKNNE